MVKLIFRYPHKTLLADRQGSKLHKAFANNSLAKMQLSKTELSKKVQSPRLLAGILGPLLKTGLPFIKNVLKPLAKSTLIPPGLTTAASATDAAI